MKKFYLLLVLAAIASCSPKESFDVVPDSIDSNIYRFGVNTNPYEYFHVAETPVPAGYKPFYISHYGRHGSRSDWAGRTYARVLDRFTKAHDAGVLTEEGENAYQITKKVIELHNNMDGRLTPLGAREHRAIAHRMYGKYKSVFNSGDKKVRAVSSVSPRCIVSMAAFTGELLSLNPDLAMDWDTGEEIMKYCNSDDPEDLKKEAKVIIKQFDASHNPDTVFFGNRIFKDVDEGRKVVGCIADMVRESLEIAAVCGSFELGDSLLKDFALEDLEHYSRYTSLKFYLRQCNSVEFGERRMAVPGVGYLVQDVIDRADEAIAGNGVNVNLRFGHDWQFLAFTSRIGIKGIAERLTAEQAVDWPGWLYTPFGANVQMVFYRNAASDVLVKFFVNERETTLITLEGGPYYKWEDFKKSLF